MRFTSGAPSGPAATPRPRNPAGPWKSPTRWRALQQHNKKQAVRRLRAGETWQDHDLVHCTRNGKPLAAGNVRRAFRSITKAVGVGEDWTPRELRHTFVSIMSDNDVPIEKIADLVGHRTTIVTQTVYRHQLPTRHRDRRHRQ